MEKTAAPQVAVLGAGIAGVQAALDLAQLGHRVVLLERAPRPGGKLAFLPKTFPTNDCSACNLAPRAGFFCIRSPYFVKLDGKENITLLTNTEIKKVTGTAGNFLLQLNREGQEEELNVAAIILCPGFEEYLPSSLNSRYGYGSYPDVLTGLELEQHLAVKKQLYRFSDGQPVHRLAFIQCVGSREPANGAPYCSGVCCMYALKEALMVCETAAAGGRPLPEIFVFYMDMRVYGKTYERYLQKARQDYGIKLVRSRIHSIIQPAGHPKLIIRYVLENGQVRVEEFDLAVLSTGMRAPDGIKTLAGELKIDLDAYGFCQSPTFTPASTSRPGIFVAGAFAGPSDVIDTVTQGSAAAASCVTWLKQSGLTSGNVIAPGLQQPVSSVVNNNPAPRVGVFICPCDDLSSGLDLNRLEEYCSLLPGVAWVQKLPICDPPARKQLQRTINEYELNRIVVAACSARALEPQLAACLAQAGLPASAVRVVNVLNHAVKIYSGHKELATQKAKDLVRMAAARMRAATPPLPESIPVAPTALVVGGGVAGMVAALTLGNLGYEVHLVEKEAQLGGNARRLHHTLGGTDLQAWLADLNRQIIDHPKVQIYLDARLLATEGQLGSFNTELEIATRGERKIIFHGITILATGAVEKKPQQYLYGQHAAVVTGLELEDLLHNNGQQLADLRKVVFIQCVNSRDAGYPYCSRTCCGETLKNALKLKKINPGIEIYILNRDIMTYGLQEQWYEAARTQGILFLHYNPESPPEVTVFKEDKTESLQVHTFDPILSEEVTIKADLLVLAAGMEPRPQNVTLASLFQVPLDDDGFFATSHPKLKTVATPVPGIFVCGLAEGPKNLEEAVSSAQAAAIKAAAVLAEERFLLPHRVAQVEGACAACLTCVRVCPHGAPAIKGHRSSIDPLLCQGCGACVAVCPAGAITLSGYSHAEIEAELKNLYGDAKEVSRSVIFTCSYCAYATFENAAGMDARTDVSVLQVPCLSRIGTLEVLKAIEAGAEQILLAGCIEGQCHFRPARAFGSRCPETDPVLCQEQAWRRARKILSDLGFGKDTLKVLRLPPPPSNQRQGLEQLAGS